VTADAAARTAITLDVDWAPDDAIDDVAALLAERGVRATWFVTHESAAVDRIRERRDLFELGIHPNFAPGSTHGDSPEAVLSHCMALVPDARAMRTHGLVQSSALLALVRDRTPVAVDASLFLPHANTAEPLSYPLATGTLRRVPYVWEDDAEMYRAEPAWDAWALATRLRGLAVFNFHPVHVVLNSSDMAAYESLKRRGLPEARRADFAALRAPGHGSGTAFESLLDGLAGSGGRLVSELAEAA
jgi:hypothetical protein